MVTAHFRGHDIYWDGNEWRYVDNNETTKGNERPCKRCGRMPTAEGYDACLGCIHGNVTSACCGHGVEEGYMVKDDELIMVKENEWEKYKNN